MKFTIVRSPLTVTLVGASARVLRGGSCLYGRYCRSAFHNWIEPDFRVRDYGVRLVLRKKVP